MDSIDKSLSNITTISLNSTKKFLDRFQDCICYSLQQQLKSNPDCIELDLYIGTLSIKNINDELFFKFIPSRSFENDVIKTFKTGECPLVEKIEDTLINKIKEAYKDLI